MTRRPIHAPKREEIRETIEQTIPALITGGAGDDPAGVVTYTIAGATTGLSQLWLLLLSTPMLAAANIMAARVALFGKDGLATIIRKRYGRIVSFIIVFLLTVANLSTIAADMAGVGAVLEMLTGIRWEIFIPFIALLLVAIMHLGYSKVKKVFIILSVVLVAYIFSAFYAHPDWPHVLIETLSPHIRWERYWMIAALGLLGTTISPYLLFWQEGEEIEELRQGITIQVDKADIGVWVGMIYSNLISAFIMSAAAITIHDKNLTITSVADAARALQPLGQWGYMAFSVGIIASVLLALPILAGSTAYAIAELFGWPEGFGAREAQARGFYLIIALSLIGGGIISLTPHFRPADALFYSQVFNGVLLPLLILMLLVLSNDTRIVGESRNPRWVNWMGFLTILIALTANFSAIL